MAKLAAIKKFFCDYPLLVAVCMNAIVLAGSLLLGNGKYSSLDDYFMSSVLTGAYGGKYDVHLYFINVLYGYFLKPFYALSPKVGWYAIFELFTVFASFSAMAYVVIKRLGNKLGYMLALLLLVCVSFDVYMNVAFTQCAGVATAAGLLLIAAGNEEKKRLYLILAGLFMVVGVVFRKDMFLVGMPTLVAFFFFSFIRDRQIWKGTLMALGLFTLVYVGIGKFDASHYRDGGYDYYAAYQGPRSYFGDGAFFDGENFVAELQDRGLPARDFRYLRAWYFYDNNVFSLDSMRALIKIADRSRFEPNYLKMPFAVMRALSDTLLQGRMWCWALLCLALIYFSNRKNWYIPWVSLFLISVPYTYLLLVNRVVGHVETGVWVYAVVFLLFFVDKDGLNDNKKMKSFFQIILLICIASLVISGTHIAFDKVSNEETKIETKNIADWPAFLKYAKERPNDVFLLPFSRYKDLARNIGDSYSSIEPGYWNNIFSTGYWNIHLPAMNRELEKRGVSNVIRDVWHDNVYVVSDERMLLLTPYYYDHYHEKLTVDTLTSFGNIDLLKYHKGESKNEDAQH